MYVKSLADVYRCYRMYAKNFGSRVILSERVKFLEYCSNGNG